MQQIFYYFFIVYLPPSEVVLVHQEDPIHLQEEIF